MKLLNQIILGLFLCLFSVNIVFGGCNPGETYVEVQINADEWMLAENTDFEIVIGGVVVYTNSIDGPVPAGPVGGVTTTLIVSGCFPEGATIDINLLNDDFGDGWIVTPPFFLILGCDQVVDGNEAPGTWTMPGSTGNIYSGTLPNDNDAIGAVNGVPGDGLPQCVGNTDWNVQPTAADQTAAGAALGAVPFPAGYTEQPFCDVAGGDDTGGNTTPGQTAFFEVCSEFTMPNVTGNETGAIVGIGSGSIELFSVIDVDGNGGENDCGGGIFALDVYDSAGALVSSGTTLLTGLTPGATYCMCITAAVFDIDANGPDNTPGTADDGSTQADGTCVLDGILATVQPFDEVVVSTCDEFTALQGFLGDCQSTTFAIGWPANPDGTVTGVPTADPSTYTYTVSSPIAGTQTDNIGFFDTTGDGNGDFLGNIITWTATSLAQGCIPEAMPVTIEIMCMDGSTATIDFGAGSTPLTAFDPWAPFGLTPNVYPDVASFVVVETPGGCGTAATVTITAPNGDQCFMDTGAIPATPACDGATVSAPLAYDVTFGDASADPLVSPAFDCSMQFMSTVAADCASMPCGAMCSITAVSASAVCSGDDATVTVSFTPTMGSGNYDVLDETGAVIASGTASPIVFTVTGPTTGGMSPSMINVVDNADSACIGTAVALNIPTCPGTTGGDCDATHGDLSIKIAPAAGIIDTETEENKEKN